MDRPVKIVLVMTAVFIVMFVLTFYFFGGSECAKCGKNTNGFDLHHIQGRSFKAKVCSDCMDEIIKEICTEE